MNNELVEISRNAIGGGGVGLWCILPDHLKNFSNVFGGGGKTQKAQASIDSAGIAIIPIIGPMAKNPSWYSNAASTTMVRQAVSMAAADKKISSIMLYIDSPGGEAAGIAELGEEIKRSKKPIHAFIDDLGASAAYWAASQCDTITMNRAGFCGSIGTYAVVIDYSEMAKKDGVKVHVLATGAQKGAGVPGSEITEDQLAHWQSTVDSHFKHFETAVRQGRRMVKSRFDKVSDGRVFDAKDAKKNNLIDAISSFDVAIKKLRRG